MGGVLECIKFVTSLFGLLTLLKPPHHLYVDLLKLVFCFSSESRFKPASTPGALNHFTAECSRGKQGQEFLSVFAEESDSSLENTWQSSRSGCLFKLMLDLQVYSCLIFRCFHNTDAKQPVLYILPINKSCSLQSCTQSTGQARFGPVIVNI